MKFSGAFSSAFLPRKKRFSLAFSAAFHGRPRGFIGPLSAQAALMGGAGWRLWGSGLVVGDSLLIGPAGKVYAFASAETATRWAENAAGAGQREAQIIASLPADRAAAWRAKKRANLEVIAGRVVAAAARSSNEAVRAALIAESDFVLSKWAHFE